MKELQKQELKPPTIPTLSLYAPRDIPFQKPHHKCI